MRRLLFISLLAALCLPVSLAGQLNKDYFLWVGQRYLSEGMYSEAIKTINILLKADPESYEGYFLRGIAKYNLDDLLGAEQDFASAVEVNPVYTFGYQYRAIARARLGNYDDALADFHEALSLRPDRAGPYYSRGITYLLDGQYEKAIDDFDRFMMLEDKVPEAYVSRGNAYLNLGDTTRAEADYDKAISVNRNDPKGYYARGNLRMQRDDYQGALADFDAAVAADTTYIPAYFGRARTYYELKKPMLAIEDFSRVLSLDSTSSLTYFNRALVRSFIGDYNRALEDYDKVAYYSPDNVLVYYNRAGLHASLGDLQAAFDDYSKAIELYPDFANAYIYRAGIRSLLRDREGAERDRATADRKIAEYRSRLDDSSFAIYADTSQRFNRLLSFDADFSGARFERSMVGSGVSLRPMFRFTLVMPDTVPDFSPMRYRMQQAEDFETQVGHPYIALTNRPSDLPADSVVALDGRLAAAIAAGDRSWQTLMLRGVTQSLIKQYTNSVNIYTDAIEVAPDSPFLYLNLSAVRSEMIDFISSLDNSFQNIVVDSDPAGRLRSSSSKVYSYDEPIAELDWAAAMLPDCAYIYYNRANLQAISGRLPEAYEDYTRAIELNPYFADAYFNRGLVQIYLKDTAKGCMDMSKAGELGIEEAYEVLKRYSGSGK